MLGGVRPAVSHQVKIVQWCSWRRSEQPVCRVQAAVCMAIRQQDAVLIMVMEKVPV